MVVQAAEDHGWRIHSTTRYWKLRCGCGDHIKTVKLTPSGADYTKNLLSWFKRTCWPED